MNLRESGSSDPSVVSRWRDIAIIALLVAIVFLLGCEQVFDTDVWWHVRSGQWILSHKSVPFDDPFTFASAGRPWIDLHWGFQLALAVAHRLGGVPGIVLFAATVCSITFVVAFATRKPGRPVGVLAACWVPAIVVLSSRFDPRPEVLSLLLMAAYLAVLLHAERFPKLVWILPVLQVAWVNVHSLFVFGPVILACFLADRFVKHLVGTVTGPTGRAWWKHVGPASAAVIAACLLNPYGIRGMLFPAELLAKIATPSNPYKTYVAEFMSLATMVQKQTLPVAAGNLYLRSFTFLVLFLPWAFLIPAIGRASHPRSTGRDRRWAAAMVVAAGVALLGTLGLPAEGIPAWLVHTGRYSPWLCIAPAAVAATAAGRSRSPIIMLLAGTVAVIAWYDWLRGQLYGESVALAGAWSTQVGSTAAIAGLIAIIPAIASGASPFLLMLTFAFAQLGLMACRNVNVFGLVAGIVLAQVIGEWSCACGGGSKSKSSPWVERLSWVLIVLLVGWLVAIPTDRFYAITGEIRHFGWGERPFWFAHDAARFAGRPGLPDKALVFDIGQTGTYVYHNGPERKLFMDSRLEVPSLETFNTYVRVEGWLQRGDPRWAAAVRRMGDPLIIINHEENTDSEATVLADPRWRCVWFDPVAAVYLPRGDGRLDAAFPSVDFAGRCFRSAQLDSVEPIAALMEARALAGIGTTLSKRAVTNWELRLPILLLGMRRAFTSLEAASGRQRAWTVLGHCCWGLTPELAKGPPDRAAPWDPATSLTWVQATCCYRRAATESGGSLAALLSLARIFEVRRMTEARTAVARQIRVLNGDGGDRGRAIVAGPVSRLTGREDAVPWEQAERRAVMLLDWGQPAGARLVFEKALDCPSQAVRLCRIAETYLAALDLADAERVFKDSMTHDRNLGAGWFGLCMTLLYQSRKTEALEACRLGLACSLTLAQRTTLERVDRFLAKTDAGTPAR